MDEIPITDEDAAPRSRMQRRLIVGLVVSALLATFGTAAFVSGGSPPRRRVVVADDPVSSTTLGDPTSTTTTTEPTIDSSAATVPAPVVTPTSAVETTTTTTTVEPAAPEAGDFTGALQLQDASSLSCDQRFGPQTLYVGEELSLVLCLRNATANTIDLNSSSADAGFLCAHVDANGLPTQLADFGNSNNMWFPAGPIAPGAENRDAWGSFAATDADIGVVTCEGAIFGPASNPGLVVDAPLENVTPIVITVLPAETTTIAN